MGMGFLAGVFFLRGYGFGQVIPSGFLPIAISTHKGRIVKGSQVLRFWRLMPKGEKVLSPKQKDRTTISKFSKNKGRNYFTNVYFNWYLS
jgi:hypothetical protein